MHQISNTCQLLGANLFELEPRLEFYILTFVCERKRIGNLF
jgi:hypothetical protein